MTSLFRMGEGFFVDDAGHQIQSTYVDLRDPAARSPITTLVKACEKQFAIESRKTIRISKPDRFREYGEVLIRDLGEGYASRIRIDSETVDDPRDLAEKRLLDDERNRAAELLGTGVTTNTTSVRTTNKSSKWITFGKNRWIFSTSIEPTSSEEMSRMLRTMPHDYDHISYIYRPREFARALGSMVAEQLGPQGKGAEMNHSFDGEHTLTTEHKSQWLIHGPVVYAEDPYATISSAYDAWDFMARSAFSKSIEYRDQREYRFVVLAEKDPTSETVDLDVSLGMLGAMEKRRGESARRVFPTINWSREISDFGAALPRQEIETSADEEKPKESLLPYLPIPMPHTDYEVDNATPVAPYQYDATDLPETLEEMTTEYSAVQALHYAVGGTYRRPKIEAASSAWHIEPCIRHLCAVFEDPVKTIRVTEDNFVIVTLNFPDESKSEGEIAVGPLGTATYRIKGAKGSSVSIDQEAFWLGNCMEEALKEAGLRVREESAEAPSESLIEGE